MKVRTCVAIAIVLASLPASRVNAATAAADSIALTVPTVEVEALRGRDSVRDIPAAAFVLTRGALARTGSARLTSTLAALPGFHGYGNTGSGELGVLDPRGFSASGESSYLKLRVDGLDVRDLENGNVDWDWVLSEDVERVEVVQGSGAWLYGDGAEGGVVNVVRANPAGNGLRVRGTARGGSFGLRTASFGLGGGSAQRAGSLRAALRQADGWRDRSEEDIATAGFSVSVRRGSALEGGFEVAALDSRREDPGSLSKDQLQADPTQAETQTDYTHSRRLLLGLHIGEETAGASWRLAPYLKLEKGDQVRTLFFSPASHPTRSVTGGFESTVRRSFQWLSRPGELRSGVQVEHSRLTTSYESYGDGAELSRAIAKRTSASAFTGLRVALDAATLARIGVRGDLIRLGPVERLGQPDEDARTTGAISPFAALSRRIGSSVTLYGNASTGFRVPTMNQLYDPRPFFDPGSGFTFSISNSDLDPQRSLGGEIGARWDGPDGGWALLSAYTVRVKDEIDFDLARFAYANLNRSWHRGVELAVARPLPGRFGLSASGSWTPTTISGGDNDGHQINGVPEGTAWGGLSWAPREWGSVEGGVRYVGRQFLDKGEQHALPDYATAELGLSARFHGARASLRVFDLFDQAPVESGFIGAIGDERFLPTPGRTVTFALSLE